MFMLPASPQQNGVAEHRIGLVMGVAHTSMIMRLAPIFCGHLRSDTPRITLNLWPRVLLTGDLAHSAVDGEGLAMRRVFRFYHPTSPVSSPPRTLTFERVGSLLPSLPYRTAPLPPTAALLALVAPGGRTPSPLPVLLLQGVRSLGGAKPGGAEPGSAEPGVGGDWSRLRSRSAGTLLLHSRTSTPSLPHSSCMSGNVGCQGRAAGARGPAAGGTGAGVSATGVVSAGGSGALRVLELEVLELLRILALEVLKLLRVLTLRVLTRVVLVPEVLVLEVLELLRLEVLSLMVLLLGDCGSGGAATGTGDPGTGGASSGGAAGGGAGPGQAGAEGSRAAGGAGAARGAGAAGAGGAAQPRLFFAPPSPSSQPPSDSVPRQVLSLPSSTGLPLQPGSPLPAPSPYTEKTGGLTEHREPASRPVLRVCSGRPGLRVPRSRQPTLTGTHLVVRHPSSHPQRVPLPALLRLLCLPFLSLSLTAPVLLTLLSRVR
ncbi:unnamed protein product [Closterium sp. NIES-65]|nr:unnamed protein product [Closterium sp. NIES-65]